MVSYNILDGGKIVRELLLGTTFDDWKLIGIKVQMLNNFEINGKRNLDFDSDDDNDNEFVNFSSVKKIFYEIIRGNKKPKEMEIILKKEDLFDTDEYNFIMTIKATKENMIIHTMASSKVFSLEKKYDILWKEYVDKLFKNLEVAYLIIE